ncbi:hypothetical protein EJ02DRAFT_433126 [Clathrospora elynae]|uniref:Uncharacterized protein n=1 Tax=Clathrospora elynae TaxID=706981 RepID=A0A6A5SSP2_9PLEO|nr:hypothetical protein EJ02DRAFT_433126 [Clathrospora elynae]
MDPPPRPPTRGEKDIECARRQARELYHIPSPTNQLDEWHHEEIQDPYIANRVKELYDDREQTNRQQVAFFAAKWHVYTPPYRYDDDNKLITFEPSDMQILYDRILSLYEARQRAIQDAGVLRLTTWSDWWQERQKPYSLRSDAFIAACESTLEFLEDDYIKRKVDFVTEVYAVLEKRDPPRAKVVLGDLAVLFPWLKSDFIARLEDFQPTPVRQKDMSAHAFSQQSQEDATHDMINPLPAIGKWISEMMAISVKVGSIGRAIQVLESALDGMEARIRATNASLNNLAMAVLDGHDAATGHFIHDEKRTVVLEERLKKHEDRIFHCQEIRFAENEARIQRQTARQDKLEDELWLRIHQLTMLGETLQEKVGHQQFHLGNEVEIEVKHE